MAKEASRLRRRLIAVCQPVAAMSRALKGLHATLREAITQLRKGANRRCECSPATLAMEAYS
jgi:hypothetical protein